MNDDSDSVASDSYNSHSDIRSSEDHKESSEMRTPGGRLSAHRNNRPLSSSSANHGLEDIASPISDYGSMPASMSVSENVEMSFKFKTQNGRVHRFQFRPSYGLESFRDLITEKLGDEIDAVGGPKKFCVAYVDDEGDMIEIISKTDISDAVKIATRKQLEKIDLLIHHPSDSVLSIVRKQKKAETKSPLNSDGKLLFPLIAIGLGVAITASVMFVRLRT